MPTRLLFVVQFFVGGFLLLRGMVHPMLPSFQLDDILTPEEMQDVELRTRALGILHRVQNRSDDRMLWIFTGGFVSLTSMAGFIIASRSPGESSTLPTR